VILTAALAALSAAALPLVRAGVESESLDAQFRTMSPLAAGFEVRTFGNHVTTDGDRRAAAVGLGRRLPALGRPVLSSLVATQVAGSAAPGTEVIALARTNAVAHVRHVTRGGGPGVWIADSTAKVTQLRPGDTMRLTIHVSSGSSPIVPVRVAGIYASLEGDRDNPYWANWQQDIRSRNPDLPPPPPFVLMSEATLVRVARAIFPSVENRYEFPINPDRVSYAGALRLDRTLSDLTERVRRDRGLGCSTRNCETKSSLRAALAIAASDVAAVAPTIALLSGIGLVIALGIGVATGLFLVRRRADEANVLFARGESRLVFGLRTAVEAALPAVTGLAAGLAGALTTLFAIAPAGTVAYTTVWDAAERAAVAALAAMVCVAAGAGFGFPRTGGAGHGRLRLLACTPWETVPLIAAAAVIALVLGGHGLVHDAGGGSHPRLIVFLVPVLIASGTAGLAVRLVRRAVAGRAARAPVAVFLALRRVAAAGGLLGAVVVACASAFGTFSYAATLSASLDRAAKLKAFVSNGSDVQGVVDPSYRITSPFPFPVALAELDQVNAAFPSGARVDLVAGDPGRLQRALRWGDAEVSRGLLARLTEDGDGLRAIATPGAPRAAAIVDQGARISIRIVGHVPIPGATAGRPALLVSRAALRRAARRAHVFDPGPQATGLLWAKGDPKRLIPILERSNLSPVYLTTLRHLQDNASVAAAERSYRFVKLVGIAAAALALVALLLYLQARQRAQLIASALGRRMGIGAATDAAALALEAGAVVLFSSVVGGVAATIAARPVVHHIDALPQYAPAPVFIAPWTTLVTGAAIAVVAAALFGIAAIAIAARSDIAGALRVA
jgi:putative ABC transport system permease protein